MSFLRHGEIYRSDEVSKPIETWGRSAASRWSAPGPVKGRDGRTRALLIVRDEFPAGYSLAGCSPAEPASASPTGPSMRWGIAAGNDLSANGNLSLISVSQPRGSLQFRGLLNSENLGPLLRLRPSGPSFSAEIASSRRIRAEDKNQRVSVH